MKTPLPVALALSLGACTGGITTGGVDGGPATGFADAGEDFEPRPKPDEVPATYDKNHLLDDDQIFGGEHISIAQMQDFLEVSGSYLAGYTDPVSGDTAAAIIVERSRAYGVSPLYMVARIQTESSLITSGTADYLEQATGCGCPDGSGCNPELGGFGNQIECAAEKMDAYFQELEADGVTRAGWMVGVAKDSSDPCTVMPVNAATAMLYTYTPWVGAYTDDACGRTDIGGSSLVALAYHRFWIEYPWDL